MALWAKTKTQSKAGFDKVYNWVDKLGAPVNRLSNKVGSEAFWPTTLDIESDKAARILKSFCKDGFYQEEDRPTAAQPNGKQRVLKKIPAKVIRNAKGLCIFTTMRTGLWVSGSGGAGVLVGRTEDGSWSPPSGIMMHTVGVGFLAGIDIYDCVIVINTQKALEAFQAVRCTLGGEVSAVTGPVGVGGILDTELHKRQAPLFTYIKSRGFYAGLQLDGTIVIERTDENERFYGERIGVKDILAGKARHPPYEVKRLMETLKAAQGDTDVDESFIPEGAPPGDFEIAEPGEKLFGVPEAEDPDPFGVLALQEAGLEIREAGTNSRPTSDQFEFKPSPTSPIYNSFRNSAYRKSLDQSSLPASRRSSWRTSTMSSIIEPRTPTTDMSTQTDDLPPPPSVKRTPPALPPRNLPPKSSTPPHVSDVDDGKVAESAVTPKVEKKEEDGFETANTAPVLGTKDPKKSGEFDDVDLDDDEDDHEEEEPIIHEVQQAAAPQVVTRARVVQVAKLNPPKIPERNPYRNNRSSTNSNTSLDKSQNASRQPSPANEKPSPDSTPSLVRGDSTSTLSSVEDHRLGQVDAKTETKAVDNKAQTEKNTANQEETFHSPPESPVKTLNGFP